MIKAAIFDLDGTVLDTLEAIRYTLSLTLTHFGLGEVEREDVKYFAGDGYKELVKRALIHNGDTELKYFEEASEMYNELFKTNCTHEIKAFDGMEQVLKTMKSRNIKLAVLSNKQQDRAEDNIYKVYGRDLFDCVYGEREGIPKKPDPIGVNMILEELKVDKNECLYLGDTDTDMKTGIAAGCITVGVLWGFRKRDELESFKPSYVFEKPEDILTVI